MRRIIIVSLLLAVVFASPVFGADKKISELDAAESVAATDTIVIVSGGSNYKATISQIKATDLSITDQAAGDILYFNGTNWVRLAKDVGKYLKSGDSAASWDIPAGAGDVTKVGTPTEHQQAVWTGDGTIKGVTVTGSKVMCTNANGEPVACTNLTDGALSTDNSTANNLVAKDSDGHIENLTLDSHLSRTGTTSPALAVVTPTIIYAAGTDTGPTAAQMSGPGVIVKNYGQAAKDIFVPLPAAAAGLSGLFTVVTARANHWGVQAAANDKIYLVSAAGTIAAGDDNACVTMVAAQLGQSFACWTQATGETTHDWFCKAVAIGTSTFEAHAAP